MADDLEERALETDPVVDPDAVEPDHSAGYSRASELDPAEFVNSDANPDEGWRDPPEGHAEPTIDRDDLLRRKG